MRREPRHVMSINKCQLFTRLSAAPALRCSCSSCSRTSGLEASISSAAALKHSSHWSPQIFSLTSLVSWSFADFLRISFSTFSPSSRISLLYSFLLQHFLGPHDDTRAGTQTIPKSRKEPMAWKRQNIVTVFLCSLQDVTLDVPGSHVKQTWNIAFMCYVIYELSSGAGVNTADHSQSHTAGYY